jgi:RNA polymerase sigma-70 factor (ECF subfamily)
MAAIFLPPETAQPPPEEGPAEELRLFLQARTGDFLAFEELVGRLQNRVHGLALRILGPSRTHDAEDVLQQTFLGMIEHLEDFREESTVAAWVLRIAANHALKILRRERILPMHSYEEAAQESFASLPHPSYIARWRNDPADLAQDAEVRRLVDEALAELDDTYRLVFVLRDIQGLSTEETAQALDLTPSNVKVRLMRARLQLRERLTRALGDPATRLIPDHHHGEDQQAEASR